jgi:leader peptidase (prepilin peptidase)/N-methyltransferase
MAILFWLALAFLLGAAVGSFLNVCVARLPFEKSLFWPGSRCLSCYQPIAPRDNVPILGYLLLRGRCRTCSAHFSVRYLVVELVTALAFTALAYFLVFDNVRRFRFLGDFWGMEYGLPPLPALPLYIHHAVLLGFLLVVSLCDLNDMEIPLSVTFTGTLVGLAFATLLPWPHPEVLLTGGRSALSPPVSGIYPWPVWYPLPDWLPPGSWQLGLATGLAGAVAGMLLLRGVRFLFLIGRGVEGLGVGDADLMMMAGAFIGWQPVVVAFFVGVFPGLLFALATVLRRGGQALPFGPALSTGVLITLLAWPALAPQMQFLFFNPFMLLVLGGGGAVILFVTAFLLWLVRGT